MVAAALGYSENARLVNIPLKGDTEAAYGIYDGDNLAKILVVDRSYYFIPEKRKHYSSPTQDQYRRTAEES